MAQLVAIAGEKPALTTEKATMAVVEALKDTVFTVAELKVTEKISRPRPPFTTSTLQQTAANRFGFTARKTMQIAQGLYEGVNIGSQRLGLITYMRTDSTRIAESALQEARDFIAKEYPGRAAGGRLTCTRPGKGAQDAHEAIRPTYVTRTPAELKKHLTSEEFRLYSIIWERFVSSQMSPSKASTTTVDFAAGGYTFRASSTRVVEKGFQKALSLLASKEQTKALPAFDGRGRGGTAQVPPRAALHHGPAAIHRRHHREDPRGERHRQALHIRAHHLGAARPLLRGAQVPAAHPHDPGKDHQRHAEQVVPRAPRSELHGRAWNGGSTRWKRAPRTGRR